MEYSSIELTGRPEKKEYKAGGFLSKVFPLITLNSTLFTVNVLSYPYDELTK